MDLSTMSGLEIMQAMLTGKIPPASMSSVIPMTGISVEYGEVLFDTMADDRHLNPMGGVHGGFAATVLDSVTGSVVFSALEAGVSYATVDLNVKMVRPVPRRVRLLAEGKLINMSKSLGISEGTLKDEQGKIYAHATSTCMILR